MKLNVLLLLNYQIKINVLLLNYHIK